MYRFMLRQKHLIVTKRPKFFRRRTMNFDVNVFNTFTICMLDSLDFQYSLCILKRRSIKFVNPSYQFKFKTMLRTFSCSYRFSLSAMCMC